MMRNFPVPAVAFAKLGVNDLLDRSLQAAPPEEHLKAAIDWLVRAHDMSPDGGVSYGYSLRGGWRPSYIETTGYIAVTFFKLAKIRGVPDFRDRAIRMVDWLRHVQGADGSFSNPRYSGGEGIVFDTGQDLFGLVWAYRETGEKKYLDAAERAGDWLVRIADAEGRWTRNEHLGVPHVYNTRTAWALLQLHAVAPTPERERIARANLDWGVSQQQSSGLFDQCAFEPGVAPFTHTIAYAIRGLWESGVLLDDPRYRDAALRAASTMTRHVAKDGFIPGQVDRDGTAVARYCCLTGNCQLAIVWAKMHRTTGEQVFRDAAISALRYVMAHQDVQTRDLDIRGAIKGSHPLWGRYSPFTYPNWATKFFVDAMHECGEWF